MNKGSITRLVSEQEDEIKAIGEKIIAKTRLTENDGLLLFERGSLSFLGALANYVRE
jgi:aminodeoxyfutalosine synthase